MNARFNEKCNLFAKEIKKESGSWMSEIISYDHVVMLEKEYGWILRAKKRADYPDAVIYTFTAFDSEVKDSVSYSVKAKNNLSNDQLLKLLICVDVFYLPIEKIKQIVLL